MNSNFCGRSLRLTGNGARTHLINREGVRRWRFVAAAGREERQYSSWILTRPATLSQRQRSATRWAKFWRVIGGVAPQSQSTTAMLIRRAWPAARQNLAHPFPISEMGSDDCGLVRAGLAVRTGLAPGDCGLKETPRSHVSNSIAE